MKNTTIFRVLIIGGITVLGMVAHQTYWVMNSWNINETEFNDKAILALHRVAQSLVQANGGALPRDIIKRKTTNYYIVNIEHEINTYLLQQYLRSELDTLELYVDCEYAVYDCTSNQMVDIGYIKFSGVQSPLNPPSEMPIQEGLNYYFAVKFLNQPSYLFGKMQLSIVFSIILLITIAFFIYAMYTILKQKRLSELQKDFINNMTHEFKTPLSTINISAEVFLNDPNIKDNNRLHQYAHIIKTQNNRLNDQVEKVLQIAKIERGIFALNKERIEIGALIQHIRQSCQPQLDKKQGKINLYLSAEPQWIEADRMHLTNVIYNLIDNAEKYCTRKPIIDIELIANHHSLQLVISDNGIGIKKEFQPRVFDKFYRIPTGNVHDVKGFGLGLFYVKKIIEAHHWTIHLTSEPNVGSTITIAIPQKKHHEEKSTYTLRRG